MKTLKLLFIITIFIFSLIPNPVSAQDNDTGPTYIVQPGENLSSIAIKFGIDISDLIAINNIANSNLISAGTELIIPGLEGISGVLTVSAINLGETVPVILKKYDIGLNTFLKLNKITSPSQTYVGSNLILPINNGESENNGKQIFTFQKDSSLLIESFKHRKNNWANIVANDIQNSSINLPLDPFIKSESQPDNSGTIFSPHIQNVEIKPLPLSQGHTAVFKVGHTLPVEIKAVFDGKTLEFYANETGEFQYAIDGIHALREPGLAELSLFGSFETGETFAINQMVLIESGGYVSETLTVESTLINQELNIIESEKVQEILAQGGTQKYWTGPFRYPVDGSLEDETIGFSSYFGNRRSYNNGEYFGFHGGLDFYILLNTFNIYAAAPGVVVFAGPMDIRGNTTFIDHGQGILSGYAHQDEILVQVGQFVNQGDLIGTIGKTGRVTGPHLHWDIWVNGNQVDPFDWIYNQYP